MKEEAKFKQILYSPVSKLDKNIFKKFYNGEDMNSIIDHLEQQQPLNVEKNDIEKLVDMGYTFKQAEEAYKVCENNLELALNYLLNNL